MEFKNYYATLDVEKTATPEEIKRAYRKLARKYHPDVSKESDAEARFKEVSEAYEALSDPERRAAYDEVGQRYQRGQEFQPPPGWDSGYEFSGGNVGPGEDMDFSDFFESLFGRRAQGARAHGPRHAAGTDHHAKITIDLEDAYRGARRSVSLRVPVADAHGHVAWQERQLDVNIPKGVREGQHLRLAGQGAAGRGGGPAGDLYLEIAFNPHPHFRVDGRDVFLNLPIAPWEAALGATVTAPTPEGSVQLTIPPGSSSGRKLRLKGKGLPGNPAGDLYAVLGITVPAADSAEAKEAYAALARSFAHFNPRSTLEA
ncbi:MAG TPA: DnaJ C-terminal domain-containing protein [Ideonella sp.]|uniref:DnaJ C-terminal domain-containing protein n=1 Tax=Ideonella sp. TaxID=1929293 RepID=UPI002E30F413|nr:DnaJ C-terminal domain-containing protein [Ideonella sp.]HEX5685142.1 DnaJ C-terminal domain-containing protein [Ideonella sp.]